MVAVVQNPSDPSTLNPSGGPQSGPGITSPTVNIPVDTATSGGQPITVINGTDILSVLFQGVTAPTVNIPSIDTTHLYDGVTAPAVPSSLGTITYGEVASAVTQGVTTPTVPLSFTTPAAESSSSSSGTPWYVWLIVAIVILLVLGGAGAAVASRKTS